MKIYITVLLLVLLSACQENETSPDNWAKSLVNNETWQANATLYSNQKLMGNEVSFRFKTYRDGVLYEHLSFTPYPLQIGSYEVNKRLYTGNPDWYRTGEFVTSDGGDALGDKYVVLKKDDNFFEITSVNGPEVKGRFRVTFVRDTTDHTIRNPELADTLRFTDGEFVVFEEEE